MTTATRRTEDQIATDLAAQHLADERDERFLLEIEADIERARRVLARYSAEERAAFRTMDADALRYVMEEAVEWSWEQGYTCTFDTPVSSKDLIALARG